MPVMIRYLAHWATAAQYLGWGVSLFLTEGVYHKEEINNFVQSICDEDVETWMACDAEDYGFQMLNDDEIVTCARIQPCRR
ncbi:hypothetical protein TNCV_1351191 [Trichonephila clavipes]|nr:hypothetical protein TNCV_1351191 [Trichonephila clavipes]